MSGITLENIQWSSLPDIDDVEPIGEADLRVLDEIREVLLRHSRADRFGVCLLHKHFELAENEIAVEYTDVEARSSTVVVEPKSPSTSGNRIETVWRFKADGPEAVTVCVQSCYYNKGHAPSIKQSVNRLQSRSFTIWTGIARLCRKLSYSAFDQVSGLKPRLA
jgi:hypothetical protein